VTDEEGAACAAKIGAFEYMCCSARTKVRHGVCLLLPACNGEVALILHPRCSCVSYIWHRFFLTEILTYTHTHTLSLSLSLSFAVRRTTSARYSRLRRGPASHKRTRRRRVGASCCKQAYHFHTTQGVTYEHRSVPTEVWGGCRHTLPMPASTARP
jgi:hypothetical protein